MSFIENEELARAVQKIDQAIGEHLNVILSKFKNRKNLLELIFSKLLHPGIQITFSLTTDSNTQNPKMMMLSITRAKGKNEFIITIEREDIGNTFNSINDNKLIEEALNSDNSTFSLILDDLMDTDSKTSITCSCN